MFSASFTLELEAVSIVPEIENMLTLYKAWIKLQRRSSQGKKPRMKTVIPTDDQLEGRLTMAPTKPTLHNSLRRSSAERMSRVAGSG